MTGLVCVKLGPELNSKPSERQGHPRIITSGYNPSEPNAALGEQGSSRPAEILAGPQSLTV